jgi:Domain of unknown function (DUF3331)
MFSGRESRPLERRLMMRKGKAENTQCFAGRRISLLERPKADLLVVDWSDARRGHCGAQHWRIVRARASGRCAFSGAEIHKGDAVFKPKRSEATLNAGDMILVSAVPERMDTGGEQLTEQPCLAT